MIEGRKQARQPAEEHPVCPLVAFVFAAFVAVGTLAGIVVAYQSAVVVVVDTAVVVESTASAFVPLSLSYQVVGRSHQHRIAHRQQNHNHNLRVCMRLALVVVAFAVVACAVVRMLFAPLRVALCPPLHSHCLCLCLSHFHSHSRCRCRVSFSLLFSVDRLACSLLLLLLLISVGPCHDYHLGLSVRVSDRARVLARVFVRVSVRVFARVSVRVSVRVTASMSVSKIECVQSERVIEGKARVGLFRPEKCQQPRQAAKYHRSCPFSVVFSIVALVFPGRANTRSVVLNLLQQPNRQRRASVRVFVA